MSNENSGNDGQREPPASAGTETSASSEEIALWKENCDEPHPVFEVEHKPTRSSTFVTPPSDDDTEWRWTVEAQTSTMDVVASWPATGRHRAEAKQDFLASLGDEITVVEWGETYARR